MSRRTFKNYDDFQASFKPAMEHFLEQKHRLEVEIILYQFYRPAELLTIDEVAAIFDAAAASGQEALLAYLRYGPSGPASSLTQIEERYGKATAALKDLLLAVLRHVPEEGSSDDSGTG
jgi:hypothetical protein